MDDYSDNSDFMNDDVLNIDGDFLIYRACCIHVDDTGECRELLKKAIMETIYKLVSDAGVNRYQIYLSPSKNFRHLMVNDYKANREGVVRPVNLKTMKKWAMSDLDACAIAGLEADDLLGIDQLDDTILWSPDKDLRQIPGRHLCEKTRRLIVISERGDLSITEDGKIYFTGLLGLYYQMLIGDTADYIVGCGLRVNRIRKSGKKIGQRYVARKGIGPKAAFKLIASAVAYNKDNPLPAVKQVVISEYKKLFKDGWKAMLETQANLLFMIRIYNPDTYMAKRWTVDGRDSYINVRTGVIYDPDNE